MGQETNAFVGKGPMEKLLLMSKSVGEASSVRNITGEHSYGQQMMSFATAKDWPPLSQVQTTLTKMEPFHLEQIRIITFIGALHQWKGRGCEGSSRWECHSGGWEASCSTNAAYSRGCCSWKHWQLSGVVAQCCERRFQHQIAGEQVIGTYK